MLSSRANSYSGRLAEKQQQERMKEAPTPDRLLTDRSSYISYLESQLERVSAACLTVQSFDERLESAVAGIRTLEEKLLNLARLVSCTQQFAEAQESAAAQNASELGRRLRAVESRLGQLEAPDRAAEWEAKLRAVSAQADAKLATMEAAAEARLSEVAGELRAGLEEACHSSHTSLEKKAGDAAGRLTEVERRVRSLDEFARASDPSASVADLAARMGSVEGSLAHLASSDSGMKASLGSLQQAVGQLKTAVVALELRPPVGDAAQSGSDCLQWLSRARDALKREVADIQQQHGQLTAGLAAATAAAAAKPGSPQKALAAQLLSGLQSNVQQEVGRELQALQLADGLLASVAEQFRPAPADPEQAASLAGACQHAAGADAGAGPAASCKAGPGAAEAAASKGSAAPSADAASSSGGWTIPAVPACGQQPAYPLALTSQQAVAAAADGTLAQLQQLAGGQSQLAAALASTAAAGSTGGSGGGGGLKQTLGEMQQMLQSVCTMLQPGEAIGGQQKQRAIQPAYRAPTATFLGRSSTQRGGSSPSRPAGQQRAWVPGGERKAAAAGGAAAAAASLYAGGISSGSSRGAKEALRESVLGQAALAERRRRLQELYAELKDA